VASTIYALASVWDAIADDAAAESPLWGEALLPRGERRAEAVFSTLGPSERALALETIYEGYLVHYGRPRLFAPRTRTRRSCSATTCTRTASSASRGAVTWTPSPISPS
jgi:hypothetical protein